MTIVNALLRALIIQKKREGLWKEKKIYMAARENRFKK
jgi:hypothetical protein